MSVFFTRARHPELPPTVMPVEAVEHYPDWVAYGEPSTDIDALNAELFAEMRAAADPAFAPAAVKAPAARPKAAPAVPETEPSAPVGAEPKE